MRNKRGEKVTAVIKRQEEATQQLFAKYGCTRQQPGPRKAKL